MAKKNQILLASLAGFALVQGINQQPASLPQVKKSLDSNVKGKPANGQKLEETETFMKLQPLLQDAVNSKENEIKAAKKKEAVSEDPPSSKSNLQSESTLDEEQELDSELENDPNHVLKEKLHRGIFNPVDQIEQKIESQQKALQIEGVSDNTKLTNSVHKNFDTIYDSMFHGTRETSFSSIHDERAKMGSNLKAMGKMSHKGANESTRKQETRMGNIKDLQLEEENVNENQELLKKIDIQKMFQKIKKNETEKTSLTQQPKKQKYKVDKNSKVPKSIQKNLIKIKKQMDKHPVEVKTATKANVTKLQKPQAKCAPCQSCPDLAQQPLNGTSFTLDGSEEPLEFTVTPKNAVNQVQVISSQKESNKGYYNVTVNMLIKKGVEDQVTVAAVQEEVVPKVEDQSPKVEESSPKVEQSAPKVEEQSLKVEEPPKIEEPKPEEPKLIVIPKKPTSPDSNSNFLAAATLFGSEQQAELEESEKYTSKIAKAEYKKIEKQKEVDKKPPQVINTQTEDEKLSDKALEQAIAMAEKNQDQADSMLLQTKDIDMEKRMQILQEEEMRDKQHKLFQSKLAQRQGEVPRFLQKQSLSQVQVQQPRIESEDPIVSDQLDKDSDENPGEQAVPKEEKSQVETDVNIVNPLQKQQVELEAHIQQEIGQLAAIMNQEYGDEDQKFEYQLVRITKKNGEEIEERYEVPPSTEPISLVQPEQPDTVSVLSQEQLDQVKKHAEQAYQQKMTELQKKHDEEELQKAREIEDSIEEQEEADEQILGNQFKDPLAIQSDAENMKVHNHHHQQSLVEQQALSEAATRSKLQQEADSLAAADLEAKTKIKHAAELAAAAEKQKALAYKKKLDLEASEWLKKKEELQKEEKAALDAKARADEAAENEKKERELLEKEKKEREELERLEKQNAEKEKKQLVDKIQRQQRRKQMLAEKNKVKKEQKEEKEERSEEKTQEKREEKPQEEKSEEQKPEEKSDKESKTAEDVKTSDDKKSSDSEDSDLDQIQKDLQEAQRVASQYAQEQSKSIKEKEKARRLEEEKKEEDLLQSSSELLTEAEQAANLKAIQQVVKAKKEGEKKGALAAQEIISRQKTQSPEQNQKDIELLQKKLEKTSQQVTKIINNFANVHKDLQELKNEYIQSQQQGEPEDSEDVEISQQIGTIKKSELLKKSIDKKQLEVSKMMENFDRIRVGLAQIEVVPQLKHVVNDIKLQLDNVSEDIDDTSDLQLSDDLALSLARQSNKIIQKKLESIMKY